MACLKLPIFLLAHIFSVSCLDEEFGHFDLKFSCRYVYGIELNPLIGGDVFYYV